MKELLRRFHLNGRFSNYHAQTKKKQKTHMITRGGFESRREKIVKEI